MYAGTTFRQASGNLLGAHQKIDRVARRALLQLLPESNFPKIKPILHFEGKNGPDGVKRKSPAQDEPWHYYNPSDPADERLLRMIQSHSHNLTAALQHNNQPRAAFEAAWLAHAIVDGLTPAHHFPLRETLEQMRGAGIETRTNYKEKLLIRRPGDKGSQVISKNWRYWGAKGIMTTHILFEIGVAMTIKPLLLHSGYPSKDDLAQLSAHGFGAIFTETARRVHSWHMYETFQKRGWTRMLARQTRQDLAPVIVKTVVMGWYEAAERAGAKEAAA